MFQNAQEELALKRRMVESLERTDQSISASLEKMAKTMDTFATSMSRIADAMTMTASTQPVYQQPAHRPFLPHPQQQNFNDLDYEQL